MNTALQTVQTDNAIERFAEYALSIRDNYSYHVKQFADFARVSTADSLLQVVSEYFGHLNTTDYAAGTIRVKRQAVKDRLRRAAAYYSDRDRAALEHELREIDRDPDLKCPSGGRGASGAHKVLQAGEYERLMHGARSERQKRFIEFLSATGCRVSEMTGVKLADCRREGNVYSVRLRGKGNKHASYKERTVWITAAMYERIISTFGSVLYLFSTGAGKRYSRSYVSNQLGKLTLKVLGRRLSAHCFRHDFVTRKLKETGRVKAVSEYAGHSDVQITLRIYGHDTFTAADVLGPEAVA